MVYSITKTKKIAQRNITTKQVSSCFGIWESHVWIGEGTTSDGNFFLNNDETMMTMPKFN